MANEEIKHGNHSLWDNNTDVQSQKMQYLLTLHFGFAKQSKLFRSIKQSGSTLVLHLASMQYELVTSPGHGGFLHIILQLSTLTTPKFMYVNHGDQRVFPL